MVRLKDGRQVELVLYKFDACWYCQRVYRKIAELGLEDGIVYRDTWQDPQAAQELIRVGGKRQVPCLFIDGQPMYESLDINAWLQANVAAAS